MPAMRHKGARPAAIVRYARNHQEMSQPEIANHYGLSRQRISQVFQEQGYTHPRHARKVTTEQRECRECGASFQFKPYRRRVRCDACVKERSS